MRNPLSKHRKKGAFDLSIQCEFPYVKMYFKYSPMCTLMVNGKTTFSYKSLRCNTDILMLPEILIAC